MILFYITLFVYFLGYDECSVGCALQYKHFIIYIIISYIQVNFHKMKEETFISCSELPINRPEIEYTYYIQ